MTTPNKDAMVERIDWQKEIRDCFLTERMTDFPVPTVRVNPDTLLTVVQGLLLHFKEEAYEIGYADGQSSRAADISFLLDEDEKAAYQKIKEEVEGEMKENILAALSKKVSKFTLLEIKNLLSK